MKKLDFKNKQAKVYVYTFIIHALYIVFMEKST